MSKYLHLDDLTAGHPLARVELEDLRMDVELYQWLRANLVGVIHLLGDQAIGVSGLTGDEFDASIRAAMRAEQFPGVDIDAAHKA